MIIRRYLPPLVMGLFWLTAHSPSVDAQEDKENRFTTWAKEQKPKCEELKAKYLKRLDKMMLAAEQAQKALELAMEENDTDAIEIAGRALRISKGKTRALKRMIARENSRIATADLVGRMQAKGHVTAASVITGKVTRMSKKKWIELDPRTPIRPGDQIRTGANGFVELMGTDGTRVQLDRNSWFVVVKQEEDLSIYKIRSGRIRQAIEHIRKGTTYIKNPKNRYKITTPYATISIRGTIVQVEVDDKKKTKLTVLEGEVELSPKKSKQKVKVKQGEEVTIDTKGKIESPKHVDLDSIKKWWEVSQ